MSLQKLKKDYNSISEATMDPFSENLLDDQIASTSTGNYFVMKLFRFKYSYTC